MMDQTVGPLPIYVAGQEVVIGYNLNGVTLAPVRDIAEALGATVAYDAVNKRVVITPKA